MKLCRLCRQPLPPWQRRGQTNTYHVDCLKEIEAMRSRGHGRSEDVAYAVELRIPKVAIRRVCLHCQEPFIARHQAALYCGVECYALANCHRKMVQ